MVGWTREGVLFPVVLHNFPNVKNIFLVKESCSQVCID